VVKHRAEIAHVKPPLQGSEVEPRQSDVDGERDSLRHRTKGRFTPEEIYNVRWPSDHRMIARVDGK